MAVGTILCASYWSASTAREAAIEQDKLLKVAHYNHSFSIWLRFCWLQSIIGFSDRALDIFWLTVQDGSDEYLSKENYRSSGFVDINTTSAVFFVVIASCFLVMLYKLMSYWFIEVLVVLFCIGGIEVLCQLLHMFSKKNSYQGKFSVFCFWKKIISSWPYISFYSWIRWKGKEIDTPWCRNISVRLGTRKEKELKKRRN